MGSTFASSATLAHRGTRLWEICAYREVGQVLRNHIAPHTVVVNLVAAVLGVIAHAARAITLVVSAGHSLGRELEVSTGTLEESCSWVHCKVV